MPSSDLVVFVESILKDRKEETDNILRLIEMARDIPPSNAFFFSVSLTCNEH